MADQSVEGRGNTVELFKDQGDGSQARVIDVVVPGALASSDVVGKGPGNTVIRFENKGDGSYARVVQIA